MTYQLYIGDRTFSSWSLRGWLMLEKFGLSYNTHLVGLYAGTMAAEMKALAPARLVPALKTPEGWVIGESMAIAETLAEHHPDAGFWPEDPAQRIRARWLCAEMASGFSALRGDCPMQLAHVNEGFVASADVQRDLARIATLWQSAWDMCGSSEEWLFGAYSLADAFYAPVAARIIGYNLDVSPEVRAYCLRTLSDTAFTTWRDAGLAVTYDPFPYETFAPLQPWPVEAECD
ncbi:MAG: glutathione S-transferase [Roseobacter sp.]